MESWRVYTKTVGRIQGESYCYMLVVDEGRCGIFEKLSNLFQWAFNDSPSHPTEINNSCFFLCEYTLGIHTSDMVSLGTLFLEQLHPSPRRQICISKLNIFEVHMYLYTQMYLQSVSTVNCVFCTTLCFSSM